MVDSILNSSAAGRIEQYIDAATADLTLRYPGDRSGQPVHTVYTSAANATADIVDQWGAQALDVLTANEELLTDLTDSHAVAMTAELLRRTPIVDLRFDFEDGYRSNGSDLDDARHVGDVIAGLGIKAGIRIPGLTADDWRRSIDLLEAVVGSLASTENVVFTIPKFRTLSQVDAAVDLCEAFDRVHGVTLRFELQIESPQAVIAADGSATVAAAIHRSRGPVRRTALRHLRLQRGVRNRRAAFNRSTIQSPTTQRPSCRPQPRRRACGCATARPRVMPDRPRTDDAHPAPSAPGHPVVWNAASTRAGTCIPAIW